MIKEAAKLLKPLDKVVLAEPPSCVDVTSDTESAYVSFDNVFIPLRPDQLRELNQYCERAMEILVEYKKNK